MSGQLKLSSSASNDWMIRALKKSMLETKEIIAANILNTAFTERWSDEWHDSYVTALAAARVNRTFGGDS